MVAASWSRTSSWPADPVRVWAQAEAQAEAEAQDQAQAWREGDPRLAWEWVQGLDR